MKHLGDITKIRGNEVPVCDCVIGGSPCQGLSQAGKREGLDDSRSGLYMEQIRIIKEMRHKDELRGRTGESIRPRYMVWENVPGAFSTNQGKDFAAVLEEAIRVAEPEAPDVPVPEKGWPTAKYRGRRMEHCLENSRCAILGSSPTKKTNLACRRFWRKIRTRNTL